MAPVDGSEIDGFSQEENPPTYLFGRTVRLFSASAALLVAVALMFDRMHEAVSCARFDVYIGSLGDVLQGNWFVPSHEPTLWRLDHSHSVSAAVLAAALANVGFILMAFAKTSWHYPRLIVFAGCAFGFLFLPFLLLVKIAETFNQLGD